MTGLVALLAARPAIPLGLLIVGTAAAALGLRGLRASTGTLLGALRLHVLATLLVSLACLGVTVAVDGLAVASGPWRDLYALPVFPWRDYVAGHAGTPDVGWLTPALGLAPFVVAATGVRVSGGDDTAGPGFTAHGPQPWMATLLRVLATALGALLLLGLAWLPLVRGPGEPVLPAFAWGAGASTALLLVALTRTTPAPALPAPTAPDPPPPLPPLDRLAWEQRLQRVGIALERQVPGDPPRILATPVEGDAGSAPHGSPFPGVIEADAAGEAVWETLGFAPWRHQHDLVRAVRAASSGRGADAALLVHAGAAGGRTTAVLAAALETWREHGRRTLLLYPTPAHARAVQRLGAWRRLRDEGLVGEVDEGLGDPVPVTIASVTWLARCLEDDTARPLLLDGLGLVALEDAQELSGLRATNASLLLRRLKRLLPPSEPCVCVVSICGNAAAASGVEEYAQRLCGTRGLVPAATTDLAPTKARHVYRIARGGGHEDAGGADRLPNVLQVSAYTRVFPAPVYLRARGRVTERQRPLPRHLVKLARGPEVGPEQAWVEVREVGAEEILSLPEQVAHGGLDDARTTDHLVVLEPDVRGRGLARWAIEQWLLSSDHRRSDDLWRADLRRLGCRLVCGDPGPELLAHHLVAAAREGAVTQAELAAMFLDVRGVGDVLAALIAQGRLREVRVPALRDGRIATETRIVPGARLTADDLRSPLDGIGGPAIPLVDPSAMEGGVLGRVPRALVGHACFPGRTFVVASTDPDCGLVRYARYVVADWTRSATTPSELDEVPCHRTEEAVTTVPLRTRTITPRDAATGVARLQPGGGAGFSWWRTAVDVGEQWRGHVRYELAGDAEEPLVDTVTHPPYAWSGRMDALVIALHDATLRPETRATLEAMVRSAATALFRTDPDAVDLVVVERLEGLAPEEPLRATPGLVILDALAGAAGLLDAFGTPTPSGVLRLLQLVWLWSDDLVTRGATPAWADLQPELGRADLATLHPDVGGVRDLVAAVLGDRARRAPPVPPMFLPPTALDVPEPHDDVADDEACSTCAAPLSSSWFTWAHAPGRRFCRTCTLDREICDFCALPAGPTPHAYPDGRSSCATCRLTAVVDAGALAPLEAKARAFLATVHLCPTRTCPVRLVSGAGIARARGEPFRTSRAFDPSTTGLCTTPARRAGEPPSADAPCEILLQDGRPEAEVLGTLVHELVHLWQYEHFPGGDVDPRWVEGLAVWANWQAMLADGATTEAFLEASRDDPVYGAGFWRVRAVEEEVGLERVAEEVLRRVARA